VDHSQTRPSDTGARTRKLALLVLVAIVAVLVGGGSVLAGCGSGDAGPTSIEEYQETLAEDPDNLEALSGLALAYVSSGRYDEALPLQERIVALDRKDTQTRVELGFNYLNHQGRPGDAVAVFEEAVRNEPSAKNLTFLAQAQEKNGTVLEAEAGLRKAIETDKTYGYPYVVLIKLLQGSGRFDEAAQVKAQAESNGADIDVLLNSDG
jgi:tetratricopeptide (TPR) repeat protein